MSNPSQSSNGARDQGSANVTSTNVVERGAPGGGRSLAYLSEIPIDRVKGLGGPRHGGNLKKAGIISVMDLLFHFPRRTIDRTRKPPFAEIPLDEEVTAIGTVTRVSLRRPRAKLSIVEVTLTDGVSFLTVAFFNQPWLAKQLPEGTEVAISGVVDRVRGRLQMKPKAVDVLSETAEALVTGRVVPVYGSINKVGQATLRRAMHNALKRARPISDPVPERVLECLNLISRDQAFADIHFPAEQADEIPARRRLAFDELYRLELALAIRKHQQLSKLKGVRHDLNAGLVDSFLESLPYSLTGAQVRAIEEIQGDMASSHPMHRLLQGEVGSGKTIVALAALLTAVQSGFQGAVMAPTEVLAEQHYFGMKPLCDEVGVRMGLLTGSVADRTATLSDIAGGRLDIVVGTHALIQEGVQFENLAMAVIDEQHRFGVHQRVQLREKGDETDPDLLIMTATPIPRTLAMTAYGDLDVTEIDEMPPGRSPVETSVIPSADEQLAWAAIEEEVAAGRQAFVVCPLVEDSDSVEAASAVAEHARLSEIFADLEVGLLHGQMPSAEKQEVMAKMRSGTLDVLVATTVIEVGIDIQNVTLMVIEDAQRFGLSQLHQLRGRVGRGSWPGRCIAISDAQWKLDSKGAIANPDGKARMEAFSDSTDGFLLAEADLRIRRQGTVLGARQSGVPDLKLANILDDRDLLEAARQEAFALVEHDPELEDHPELRAELRAVLGDAAEFLLHS